MKKRILFIAFVISSLVYSYAQEQLNINTNTSELKWSCDYSFYFGGHYGLVEFKEGYFIKENRKITGGTFIIDLKTITSTDVENIEANEGLVNHIKNEDFFDVKKYPTAKLVITRTQYHDDKYLKIFADLTIKGITKPINFQAEINYEEKTMTTRFKIDRTLWDINYKSKSIMSEFKNDAISDAIGFEIRLNL